MLAGVTLAVVARRNAKVAERKSAQIRRKTHIPDELGCSLIIGHPFDVEDAGCSWPPLKENPPSHL